MGRDVIYDAISLSRLFLPSPHYETKLPGDNIARFLAVINCCFSCDLSARDGRLLLQGVLVAGSLYPGRLCPDRYSSRCFPLPGSADDPTESIHRTMTEHISCLLQSLIGTIFLCRYSLLLRHSTDSSLRQHLNSLLLLCSVSVRCWVVTATNIRFRFGSIRFRLDCDSTASRHGPPVLGCCTVT